MKYTEDHEWLKTEGDVVVVGITAHASEQLGDVVFVELPETGKAVSTGDEICVIESVKAASDIRAPLDGEIVEVNGDLLHDHDGQVGWWPGLTEAVAGLYRLTTGKDWWTSGHAGRWASRGRNRKGRARG